MAANYLIPVCRGCRSEFDAPEVSSFPGQLLGAREAKSNEMNKISGDRNTLNELHHLSIGMGSAHPATFFVDLPDDDDLARQLYRGLQMFSDNTSPMIKVVERVCRVEFFALYQQFGRHFCHSTDPLSEYLCFRTGENREHVRAVCKELREGGKALRRKMGSSDPGVLLSIPHVADYSSLSPEAVVSQRHLNEAASAILEHAASIRELWIKELLRIVSQPQLHSVHGIGPNAASMILRRPSAKLRRFRVHDLTKATGLIPDTRSSLLSQGLKNQGRPLIAWKDNFASGAPLLVDTLSEAQHPKLLEYTNRQTNYPGLGETLNPPTLVGGSGGVNEFYGHERIDPILTSWDLSSLLDTQTPGATGSITYNGRLAEDSLDLASTAMHQSKHANWMPGVTNVGYWSSQYAVYPDDDDQFGQNVGSLDADTLCPQYALTGVRTGFINQLGS